MDGGMKQAFQLLASILLQPTVALLSRLANGASIACRASGLDALRKRPKCRSESLPTLSVRIMKLIISSLASRPADAQPVEIVECKGKGHPDTICDSLAEELGLALTRFYREKLGIIHHHNVDKALLWAGSAQPAFGGGKVLEPWEVFLCGRAAHQVGQCKVPLEDLALQSSRKWLQGNLHALDVDRHVRIRSLIRPGSPDLVALYRRQQEEGVWLANDTSCGVGHAPASELERVALEVERELTCAEFVRQYPAVGEDVKVMGMRYGDCINLTLSCALIGAHLQSMGDYLELKQVLAERALEIAAGVTARPASVSVNAADQPRSSLVYLTVTGTSAEAGDDGQAGRGNRVGGLITPCRPMVMESAAGKNPVTHVGKLYNIAASRIAADLVEEVDGLDEAHCFLVSRIGNPVQQPQLIQLRVRANGEPANALRQGIEEIVHRHLDGLERLWEDLLKRTIRLF